MYGGYGLGESGSASSLSDVWSLQVLEPTPAPTPAPTVVPTAAPTTIPTDVPTMAPSDAPTTAPTTAPSAAHTLDTSKENADTGNSAKNAIDSTDDAYTVAVAVATTALVVVIILAAVVVWLVLTVTKLKQGSSPDAVLKTKTKKEAKIVL